MWLLLSFNLRFDISATVLATIQNIERFFQSSGKVAKSIRGLFYLEEF
jgi:hypothetical protein